MIITATVTFVPSQAPNTPVDVPVSLGHRAVFARVLDLASSSASPDGTYVVRYERDEPTPLSIEIPIPTATRLQTNAYAVADLEVLVQPEDPRLFAPLSTFCPRLLQQVKNAVTKAVADTSA